jgi:threonylcarbamoyladenosine tRNA methylthiotransferase MtaB
MLRLANEAGHDAGTVIVNTCAVTGEAVRQAAQAIRHAVRARPDARIVVTGCAAQTEPERFAAMPEVAHVLGNREKMLAASWQKLARGGAARLMVGDIMAPGPMPAQRADVLETRARASLQVQNGCDHRCTFCIIPFGRGNARSAPLADAVAQLRLLVE